MSDRIEDFIIEAREHLSVVEDSLLALEKQPDSNDASGRIDRCFRSIHSIKGDAGFLGLQRINELSHSMETLLGEIQIPASVGAVETLLVARDRLAVMVDNPSQSHLVEIADLLWRLSSRGAAPESTPIDINLVDAMHRRTGGLVSYIQEMTAKGSIRDGQIHLSQCDLRAGLPIGAVRWTALLASSKSVNVSQPSKNEKQYSNQGLTTHLTVDLLLWPKAKNGLVSALNELNSVASLKSGQITINPTDLRHALPSGPVNWSAECQTELSQAEFESRFGSIHLIDASPKSPPQISIHTVSTETTAAEDRSDSAISETTVAKNKSATTPPPSDGGKSSTLRIQVELLDRLMTLVGELTLVRNQSLLAFADHDGAQRDIIQRLNSVTSELQDATLRARMQPVGNLFNKFPRMVRDLARQLGKQVEIELQGREVELDKTILEQLSDPLMHLIRNSIDHGIEMPDERIAKKKSAIGRIVLSATHEDGQVHIQIRDDGKGIDSEAVKAKALSLRLKSEAELERMTARELFSLILLPGFSTAKKVTEVSGRGVGMDVVKTNIEQLEGTLNIDSVLGAGCSMVLRLPLTLAIIPCLIVTVGDERFAVPQRDLEEVVCLHPKSPGRIERAFNTEVYRLRDKLLPIVRLSDVLRRKEPFSAQAKAEILAANAVRDASQFIEYILVLRHAGHRFGLIVDEVRGTQEIVVKPMHNSMKRVGIFTGATIMGDGRVALITDCPGIVEHARLSFESQLDEIVKTSGIRDAAQAHRVLLFEYGPNERFALPLLQIRRIEMINRDRIEHVGNQEFVTVDGVSTRILRLDNVINTSAPPDDSQMMPLILPKFVNQAMGILVSRIVDTESLALDLQPLSDQDPSILGSAIVRDRLTLFLETHRLSEKLFGTTPKQASQSTESSTRGKRVLLIDDTAFFREVVKRYLKADGHEVMTAINGEEGLLRLGTGYDFDLIVSDIEMPVMDGWEFAREARRRGVTLPMLALTSLSGTQYESKAKDCGFDAYEVKLDHDRLLRKIGKLLAGELVPR